MVLCIYRLVPWVRFSVWMKIPYIIKCVCSLLQSERKGNFKTCSSTKNEHNYSGEACC